MQKPSILTTIFLLTVALSGVFSISAQHPFIKPRRKPPSKSLRLQRVYHHATSKYPDLFRRYDISEQDIGIYELQQEKLKQQSPGQDGEFRVNPFSEHTVQILSAAPQEIPVFYSENDPNNVFVHSFQTKEMLVPDHTSKETILAMAWMTYDAYYEPGTPSGWIDIGHGWNVSDGFGWRDDGVRGYVFLDDDQDVAVIAIKGTSASFLGIGGGPTSGRDKLNDNMMFSCCCARVDLSWKPICDCYQGHDQCSYSCINGRSNYTDSYYSLANAIFQQIRKDYPDMNLWLTGHSLGGALASLTALRNNHPAIAFEAPGDLMFASRLGLLPPKNVLEQWMSTGLNRYISAKTSSSNDNLRPNWWKRRPPGGKDGDEDNNDGNNNDTVLPIPKQPRYNYADYAPFLNALPIYHVGNNGDPVFLGVCTGPASACYYAGYALESKCHVGKTCVYDVPDEPGNDNSTQPDPTPTVTATTTSAPTLEPLQSRLDVRNHRIEKAVQMYFEPYPGVPECKVETGCVDCETWDFI